MPTYPTLKFEVDFDDEPTPGFYDVVSAWGPVAYWRLDETSGTNANDSGANNFDGTYTGGVTLNQTAILADGNACASFDGTDDYVSVAYSTTFRDLIPPWTLSAWIYPTAARSTDTQFASIITYDRASGSENVPFHLGYGRLDSAFAPADTVWCGFYRADVTGGTWLSIADANTVRLNEWQHYTAVADVIDSEVWLSLYRNGERVAGPSRQAQIGAAGTASRSTFIGRKYNATLAAHYFPGNIDEPVIFNRALSEVEAAKLYASSYATVSKSNYVEIPAATGQASRVLAFSSRRGRQDAVSRVEAGEAVVLLDNRDDVLSPDPLANLLTNPSCEADATTGWSLQNGTSSRSTTRAYKGSASWQLTSSGSGEVYMHSGGSGAGLQTGLRPGRLYTYSAYVYLSSGESVSTGEFFIRVKDYNGSTTQTSTGSTPAGQDAWHRVSVNRTIRTDATDAWIEIGFTAGGASEDVWIDAQMLEEHYPSEVVVMSYPSSYADGEQTDCRWNGKRHLSPTHRELGSGYRNVLPMRMARLSCTWNSTDYPILEGPVTAFRYNYPARGHHATVELRMTDGMAALASATLSNLERPQESVPDRVRSLLKSGGIPSADVSVDDASCSTRDLRQINSGSATTTSPLAAIRSVEETEGGLYYVKADGTHYYHGGLYRDITAREELVINESALATGYNAAPYMDGSVAYDEQNLVNDQTITHEETSWVANIVMPESIGRYWPRSQTSTGLFFEPVVLTRQRSEAAPRVEPLTIAPAADPTNLWPRVLGLEISDLVRVERNVTRDVLRDYLQWVEGIEHDASPSDWRVRLHTSSEIITGSPAILTTASGIAEPTLMTAGKDTDFVDGVESSTTESVQYRAGRLYCLFLKLHRNDTTNPSDPSAFTSSHTWTQIRTDTRTAGSSYERHVCYYALPTADSNETLGFTFGGATEPESVRWAVIEVAYGFDAADPIGVDNFSTGSSATGTTDVGTLDSIYSRVLAAGYQGSGTTASWGRYFEIYESDPVDTDDWTIAYGPEGTGVATTSWATSEAWSVQAFEIKAQ